MNMDTMFLHSSYRKRLEQRHSSAHAQWSHTPIGQWLKKEAQLCACAVEPYNHWTVAEKGGTALRMRSGAIKPLDSG